MSSRKWWSRGTSDSPATGPVAVMAHFNADVEREVRRLGGQLRLGPYPAYGSPSRLRHQDPYGPDHSWRHPEPQTAIAESKPHWLSNNSDREARLPEQSHPMAPPSKDHGSYLPNGGEPFDPRSRGFPEPGYERTASQRPPWLSRDPGPQRDFQRGGPFNMGDAYYPPNKAGAVDQRGSDMYGGYSNRTASQSMTGAPRQYGPADGHGGERLYPKGAPPERAPAEFSQNYYSPSRGTNQEGAVSGLPPR